MAKRRPCKYGPRHKGKCPRPTASRRRAYGRAMKEGRRQQRRVRSAIKSSRRRQRGFFSWLFGR